MKKIFLLLFIAIILLACASPAEDIQVAEPTATIVPTQTSTPTIEPTPTPSLPAELQTAFDQIGVDPLNLNIPNITIDKDTGTITIKGQNGEDDVTMSAEDFAKRTEVKVIDGQPVLRFYNEDGKVAHVLSNGEVLYRNNWIVETFTHEDNCPTVDNYKDVFEVARKASLFFENFNPDDVFFPDYDSMKKPWEKHDYWVYNEFLFGPDFPEGMKTITERVSCVTVRFPGHPYPTVFPIVQVRNIDGSSDVLVLSSSPRDVLNDNVRKLIQERLNNPDLVHFPVVRAIQEGDELTVGKGYMNYLDEENVPISNGGIVGTRDDIEEWLRTGKLPDRMKENIYNSLYYYYRNTQPDDDTDA